MANTASAHVPASNIAGDGETRRDFLLASTVAFGAVGTAVMVWPLVHSMNPAADTLALSTTEFSLAGLQEGQGIVVVWRGKPVFVRYRTQKEIDDARATAVDELTDPQKDEDRVQKDKEKYLILVGICTHLGCIPMGTKQMDPRGDFGGWFCPCHGSHYDTSGRIRKGPAPANLEVPPYKFLSDTTVLIG
jgi:ubiquinol-cytochrome c reductase iron-sulfur subunit